MAMMGRKRFTLTRAGSSAAGRFLNCPKEPTRRALKMVLIGNHRGVVIQGDAADRPGDATVPSLCVWFDNPPCLHAPLTLVSLDHTSNLAPAIKLTHSPKCRLNQTPFVLVAWW